MAPALDGPQDDGPVNGTRKVSQMASSVRRVSTAPASRGKSSLGGVPEDGADGGADEALVSSEALATYQSKLMQAVDDATQKLLEDPILTSFELEDAEWTSLQQGVRSAVEIVSRAASEHGMTMQQMVTGNAKKKIKAQEVWATMKLETVRKAASVELHNQACALEASHNRMLEAAMAEAKGGDDDLLKEGAM